jgi:hypothetical protein
VHFRPIPIESTADVSALFHFTPTRPVIDGRAYPAFIRIMSIAMVAVCALWWWRLGFIDAGASAADAGGALAAKRIPTPWMLAGLTLMAYTAAQLQVSRTRIDSNGVHQSWIWDKHMAWQDMGMVKLIRLRGLEWLIAPRLYTRSMAGKLAVFYAASPDLLAAFTEITLAHAEHKNQLMKSIH